MSKRNLTREERRIKRLNAALFVVWGLVIVTAVWRLVG
jgi:hypothetical protein